jgi:hypothetical protein
MKTFRETVLCAVAATALVSAIAFAQSASQKSAAAAGLEKLKGLEGEWIDADGAFGKKGAVAVTYKVTSGGKTVIETLAVNTPEEMATVYHVDGNELVLTHYCSGGTQPRMRSRGLSGNTMAFDFEGGANIDPAVTSHMHSAQIEFISQDEVRATWHSWSHGKPDTDHTAKLRIVRKK